MIWGLTLSALSDIYDTMHYDERITVRVTSQSIRDAAKYDVSIARAARYGIGDMICMAREQRRIGREAINKPRRKSNATKRRRE